MEVHYRSGKPIKVIVSFSDRIDFSADQVRKFLFALHPSRHWLATGQNLLRGLPK